MLSQALAAATGIVLAQFGAISELAKGSEPWRGFKANDPVLTIARAQKVSGERYKSCEAWIEGLRSLSFGTYLGETLSPQAWAFAAKSWAPWSEEDLEAVNECEDFPCLVKLNRQETSAMKATPGLRIDFA